MVLWTSALAAAGAASLCGILLWSEDFWSVLGCASGVLAGFLPWSGAVDGCCWSGLAGCVWGELGDELCGMLCAIAKPLPSTTINASLLKCCLSISSVSLFVLIQAPWQQIRVPKVLVDEARVIGATFGLLHSIR